MLEFKVSDTWASTDLGMPFMQNMRSSNRGALLADNIGAIRKANSLWDRYLRHEHEGT